MLENGKATVLDCLQTVMEEEFRHNRYAQGHLAVLERTSEPDPAELERGGRVDARMRRWQNREP